MQFPESSMLSQCTRVFLLGCLYPSCPPFQLLLIFRGWGKIKSPFPGFLLLSEDVTIPFLCISAKFCTYSHHSNFALYCLHVSSFTYIVTSETYISQSRVLMPSKNQCSMLAEWMKSLEITLTHISLNILPRYFYSYMFYTEHNWLNKFYPLFFNFWIIYTIPHV